MTQEKLISESLFERYLVSQGMTCFDYEKMWDGVLTRPDYTLYHNGDTHVFDVKQFEDKRFVAPTAGLFAVDRYCRIREKINNARRQFKHQLFKDKRCCLVLYTLDPFVRLHEPSIVLGAMYVPNSTKQAFLENGKMFRDKKRNPQNQTISALITLRMVEKARQIGVIVWENYLATKPFPRDIFCGPYDQRWGRDGDLIKRVFVGEEVRRQEMKSRPAANFNGTPSELGL